MKFKPFSIFEPGTSIGVICLNSRFDDLKKTFLKIFPNAFMSVYVDGFNNRIYDSPYRETHKPSVVSGDFDSIRPDVKDFYAKMAGVEVMHTPDQDATDFTKALAIMSERIVKHETTQHNVSPSSRKIDYIVGLYGSGGRADHEFGIIKSLYIAKELTDVPVLLLTESSITFLLSEGSHEIDLEGHPKGLHCGLIPIGRPVKSTTTGLCWNLNDDMLDFEGIVSTSNMTDSENISVTCDAPLLLTISNYVSPTL